MKTNIFFIALFLILLSNIDCHIINCKQSYTTVKGDDCYKIAVNNKMSKEHLEILNPGKQNIFSIIIIIMYEKNFFLKKNNFY